MSPVATGRRVRGLVGNDVVDLGNPRVLGKERDARFLQRIFTARERATIESSSNPSLDLWGMWGAKEAAFKILSKRRSAPPPFEHQAFRVVWTPPWRATFPYGSVSRAGTVRHGDTFEVLVEVSVGERWLTALAQESRDPLVQAGGALVELTEAAAPWAADESELLARLSEREADAVHSRASAAVRVGARRDLAGALAVEEARLEIVCDPGPTGRRPPRVLLDGAPADADVSLSHDGAWVAWAWSVA